MVLACSSLRNPVSLHICINKFSQGTLMGHADAWVISPWRRSFYTRETDPEEKLVNYLTFIV
jgi:hypothetical protein